jgi:hypothetical protein
MAATRAEMATGDKSACADAKLEIEWMPNEAIPDRKSRQRTRLRLLCCGPTWRPNAHD